MNEPASVVAGWDVDCLWVLICTGSDRETVGSEVDNWWMINCDEDGSSCSM